MITDFTQDQMTLFSPVTAVLAAAAAAAVGAFITFHIAKKGLKWSIWSALAAFIIVTVPSLGVGIFIVLVLRPTPASTEDSLPEFPTAPPPGTSSPLASSPSPPPEEESWELAWKDQEFRFGPSGASENRVLDFDADEVPEVREMDSDEYRQLREAAENGQNVEFPWDLSYYNNVWGRIALATGSHQLGHSEPERPAVKECRNHARSRTVDLGSVEFNDGDVVTSPIQPGDGLCLITDQDNVVWIKITDIVDTDGPHDSLGGHTLEGTATLWRRS